MKKILLSLLLLVIIVAGFSSAEFYKHKKQNLELENNVDEVIVLSISDEDKNLISILKESKIATKTINISKTEDFELYYIKYSKDIEKVFEWKNSEDVIWPISLAYNKEGEVLGGISGYNPNASKGDILRSLNYLQNK